ncbi:hypothetical protein AB0O91_38160 [Kitasatospora sp. NPDC089797]|uniref:hypothetical protein n=1 Tax=Kitasatospora sp. NPDC089797 TaxID=3155298 RepID=UPI003440C691
MPAERAFAAVVADDAPGREPALAALALVAGLRADLDAARARMVDAALAAGASRAEVDTSLGTAGQPAAEDRHQTAPPAST